MSKKQTEAYIELLWIEYQELLSNWDGKNLSMESKLQEMAGELEELGVDVDNYRKA